MSQEEMVENTELLNKGTVKWFRNSLGYGFLTYLDGNNKGKDVFVHHSGIKPIKSQYKTLQQGEYVDFSVIDGDNGPQAINVQGVCGGPLMCDYWYDKKEIAIKKGYKGKSSKKKSTNKDSENTSEVEQVA